MSVIVGQGRPEEGGEGRWEEGERRGGGERRGEGEQWELYHHVTCKQTDWPPNLPGPSNQSCTWCFTQYQCEPWTKSVSTTPTLPRHQLCCMLHIIVEITTDSGPLLLYYTILYYILLYYIYTI